ncbi:MAG: N-acyl homoserine lactonase family protein [Actinomycetota bacterium]
MISPVLLSELTLPEHHPRAGEACVVFGFVIHHSDGPILVDSGVGTGRPDIDEGYLPIHHPIDKALADVGVHLADVTMVINSHLHFDHCGNNHLFPGIPLVVQRAEYDLTHEPDYTIPEWIHFPGAEWTLVEGATEVMPGVKVFPTPGHTPGHQSVIVSGFEDVQVIAGQAVYDSGELTSEVSIEALSRVEAQMTSLSARAIKAANPNSVFFSHDANIWEAPGT